MLPPPPKAIAYCSPESGMIKPSYRSTWKMLYVDEWCGDASYYPSVYTCYGADSTPVLCPRLDGEPTYACGRACYSSSIYNSNPALHGQTVKTCVYCYNAPPLHVYSLYQNETVLVPSSAMFIDQDNGWLRTTAAGKASGSGRQLAGANVTGFITHDEAVFWLARPEDGLGHKYGIFAPYLINNYSDCSRTKLLAAPTAGPKQGAYSYA
ncbi:hypothetical protein QBC39DRAFT_394599 [Podospora conica]|nr:hypothetical protein QBC39DRAFT_394599 [Schizothecium conicum]